MWRRVALIPIYKSSISYTPLGLTSECLGLQSGLTINTSTFSHQLLTRGTIKNGLWPIQSTNTGREFILNWHALFSLYKDIICENHRNRNKNNRNIVIIYSKEYIRTFENMIITSKAWCDFIEFSIIILHVDFFKLLII